MDARPDRSLSPQFTTCFFQGIAREMRPYALEMILRQEDLYPLLPRDDQPAPGMQAREFARLQAGLRHYFGLGARGMLNRLGRRMWLDLMRLQTPYARLRLAARRILPAGARIRGTVELLAEFLRQGDGDISFQLSGADLACFMDRTSDGTLGQETEEAVCWMTQGLLQEALHWATKQEYEVEEITCRGMGAPACQFKITPMVGGK